MWPLIDFRSMTRETRSIKKNTEADADEARRSTNLSLVHSQTFLEALHCHLLSGYGFAKIFEETHAKKTASGFVIIIDRISL